MAVMNSNWSNLIHIHIEYESIHIIRIPKINTPLSYDGVVVSL